MEKPILFRSERSRLVNEIDNEIRSQLYNLRKYVAEILLIIQKEISGSSNDIIDYIKNYLKFGIFIYNAKAVHFNQILQIQSQILRLCFPYLNKNVHDKISRLIIVGLILNKLAPFIPGQDHVIPDIFTVLYYDEAFQGNHKIDLQHAATENPYLVRKLLEVLNQGSSDHNMFSICLLRVEDYQYRNFHDLLKMLSNIEVHLSFSESDKRCIKEVLCSTEEKNNLLKHVTIEILWKQSPDEAQKTSWFLKNLIIENLLSSSGLSTETIINTDEKLCYILVVNDSLPPCKNRQKFLDLGWFILASDSSGLINILLSLINILIDSQSTEMLSTLLKSKCMNFFNQLLLINLWHPDLSNVTTMQILLDTCYLNKCAESDINHLEKLGLKIRTRWDTLKKFNASFSNLTRDQSTHNIDIIALTTMGNTSHLELIAGLSDPTSFAENVISDLLERTGQLFDDSKFYSKNIHLESEILEENCDKSIFYSVVAIRKIWECLILFSSIKTRQSIFDYLHQNNFLLDIDLVDTNESFYMKFRSALQESDSTALEEIYQESILSRLNYLTQHIDLITPLSLRLELLENIYSLIFITEFDLFTPLLTNGTISNTRNLWQMPDTIKISNIKQKGNLNSVDLSMPNLDKNRLVCSFFLCKDLLVLLENHLSGIVNHENDQYKRGHEIDNKMAAYINYPTFDSIKARTQCLTKALHDLRWRMEFLSVDKIPFKFGKITLSINFIIDFSLSQFSGVFRSRPNQKIRSKSSTSNPKPLVKMSHKSKSVAYSREMRDPEYINEIDSTINVVITNSKKDQNKASIPQIKVMDSSLTSNDDLMMTELCRFKSSNKLKVNYRFIMECMSWIIEPIEYLAITALVCGYKDKVHHIVEMCDDSRRTNPLLTDLLTEIKYQKLFDQSVDRLSQITTPSVESEEKNKSNRSFGHFDWNRLPALREKLSSRKENEVVEVVNHLLMLNDNDRPLLKIERMDENQIDDDNLTKLSDYNNGLLLDLGLYGSTTKWQLMQILIQIQSRQIISGTLFDSKPIESTQYHKLSGIKPFVKQLHDCLVVDMEDDKITYTDLEMSGSVEIEYFTKMQKWLSKIQTLIKLLRFNITDSVDFQVINSDSDFRWKYLSNLTDFVRNSSCVSNASEMPFKYLLRNVPRYLESLQSHLKVFVNFLIEHKSLKSNSSPTNQRYLLHEFSVLKRSPSDVLGELIFFKIIDPQGNEIQQISQDLGLNISEVILQNCLPAIHSYSDKTELDQNPMSFLSTRKAYNEIRNHDARDDCTLNPIVIVTNCLNKVVNLFLKNSKAFNIENYASQLDQSIFELVDLPERKKESIFTRTSSISSVVSLETSGIGSDINNRESSLQTSKVENPMTKTIIDWKIISSLSEEDEWINVFKADITKLNYIDLDLLKTNNDKTAFFINLYNLMLIHLTLMNIQNGKSTLKYRSFESRMYRENFCYNVGQLGILSVHEICQNYLNISDITFSDLNYDDLALHFPLEMEQKYGNACPVLQTLSIFGLTDGTVSGPPLKVYQPVSLVAELQNNLSNMLKYMSNCDSGRRQIHLPQLFKWFNTQISLNLKVKVGSLASMNKILNRNEENLFERILSHCTDDVSKKYFNLFRMDTESISYNTRDASYPKSVKIIWLSRVETIGCTLIEKISNVSCSAIQKTCPDLIDDADLTIDDNNVQNTSSFSTNIPPMNYRPTFGVLEHLRKACTLLAALVYTIIGDDLVSDSKSSDLSAEHKSIIDDQISEVHSYKYSRLQEIYSAIGKWIIRYWSSWHFNAKVSLPLDIRLSSHPNPLMAFCRDNVPLEIRWAIFNHFVTKNLQNVLIDYSIQFMNQNSDGYFFICSAIRNLPVPFIENCVELQRLLDILLIRSAKHWAIGLTEKNEACKNLPPDQDLMQDESAKYRESLLLDCLYAIKNDDLRLSESNRYCHLLNIHSVAEFLEMNYSTLDPNNEKLFEKLQVLRIFKRIHDLVSYCQSKDEVWFKAHLPIEFLSWQKLQSVSENNPEQVFKFLIQQKKFDLCRKWCQFFMKQNGEERTEAEFIISFVNEDNDKQNLIELTLHVSNLYRKVGAEKFLEIVHFIIGHNEIPLTIIICCAFIIKEDVFTKLKNKSLQWQGRIIRAWVGASMLRSIPNGITRDLYSHLVEHPSLIMEQLIMNSQIDLFRKMIELCRELKKAYLSMKRSQSTVGLSKLSHEEFIEELESQRINKLIIEYTFKALELPAVRVDDDNDNDDLRLLSRGNSSSSFRNEIYLSNGSSETLTRKNSFYDENIFISTAGLDDNNSGFHTTVPQNKWIQDKDASICMCCKKEEFSMFNRRHHCRKCGRVICGGCSMHRTMIKGLTVRICNDCHKSIQNSNDFEQQTRYGNIMFDDKNSNGQGLIDSFHNPNSHNESPKSSLNANFYNYDSFDQSRNVPNIVAVGALENGWKMSIDSGENDMIRQMFYYDDAPSITLAFSLIFFHSNSNECGNKLLERVEYLADFLKPMKTGLPNSEVDYLLVIDIAKRIAYKAKEKLSFMNNDVDFGRAEIYLSRLDLLGILVRSNYSNCLPPLGDGSKFIEKIRYLRDKLIGEERLELARIVSDKAGLSNDPVLIAMGLHALEEGKYEEARKFFASCSKSRQFAPITGSLLPHPLNEIMKILDRHGISIEKMGEILNNIKDNSELLKNPESKYIKDCEITQKQIEEAIYYFDVFNAPLHCLQFLCRQQMWSKATDYAIKKNVSKDFFIKGLVAPAVSTGRFSAVKNEMLMRDGGINIWRNYYEVLCEYLDQNRCYEDLLEWQELNGDNFRVARTLIRYFYLAGSQSYIELEKRIPYLDKARKHMEKLIKISDNNDAAKYEKNLTLIKQQTEATKFLSNQISVSHLQAGYGYQSQSSQPPTLFGNAEAIMEFCLMIIFCRPNLLDGLQMLCPLMSLCHIYPEKILPKAAKWLLENPSLVIQMKGNSQSSPGLDSVLDLCKHICTCFRLDSRKCDDILIAILTVIPLSVFKTQTINKFNQLLQSEQKKTEAFLLVKDFKRAYASAIKLKSITDVRRILDMARSQNDTSGVIDLCEQWLSTNRV